MIIWGGGSGGPHLNTGARYNPEIDAWSAATPLAGAPAGRASFVAAWTGKEMIIWGGEENGTLVNTGGLYQPPILGFGPYTGAITITVSMPDHSATQTIQVSLSVAP
jgi:hypothetical protein